MGDVGLIDRATALAAATSGDLDLLVVGGGITGAGAALDAASRGVSVALVEARDLGAGLVLYDTIGGARSVPRHRHLRRLPAALRGGFAGGVQFYDAASDDARVVVSVARTAVAHGAHVATRVRVTGMSEGAVRAV